eukprot:superscaffoldBa00002753_g15195
MAPSLDRQGYWGRPTSTLDWCEENYVVSFYIAEFWNTVSNLIMILPPIYGAIQTFRDGLEFRYICSFLGLAAVGVGSWCFHMTLLYEMQLLDELPMIYSTCVFVYCLYECFKQENSLSLFPIALLLIFSVSVTVVYLQWKEPVFHQVMYGALVACLVMRSIFIVTWVYPWLRPLCYTSLGVFMLGFLLWNIDNIFCDSLRASRRTLPPGVGVVTQFHAWWHIFTGLGSYLHILLSLQIRSTYLKYRPKVKEYLKHFYGYQPKPDRRKRTADNSIDADWTTGFCDKVQEMQRFFGLPQSGELTKETLEVMKRPRCGLSDVERFGDTMRWKKHNISYRIAGYNLTIPASQIHKLFKAAWKLWSNVTPLQFRKRSRKEADIVISFHSGDHKDGSPFDGKKGILAHAFMPGFGIGGDVHFDADEDWSFNSTGFNLFAVAVHEFGHALGLSHSSDPGAIMYPSYNFAPNYEPQLSFRDVKDIQHLYGHQYWMLRQLNLEEGYPRNIWDLGFPSRIKSIDAALHFTNDHYTVFFTGHECWRYDEQQKMMEGSPTLIKQQWPGIPYPIDAAVFYEGFVHFFKGNVHYKYDSNSKRVVSTGPANDLLECKKDNNEILMEGR